MRDTARKLDAWWRRQSADWKKRVLLPRLAAVSLVVVIGSIVVAKLAWGTKGPTIVTPFAFAGLFFAAVVLFAVAIASCQEFVDELEASHPPRVRKRGVIPRALRSWIAAFAHAVLVWLVWLGTAIRREVTRKSAAQWRRDLADALSGLPPAGVSTSHAGPLARPVVAPPEPRPRRIDEHHRAIRRSRPREEARTTLERLAQLYRQHRPLERPRKETVRHRERTSNSRRAVRAD